MKKNMLIYLKILSLVIGSLLLYHCSDDKEKPSVSNEVWDIEKDGIPKFVKVSYIEPDKIYRISRFRSSVGHDYSDAFENCRSMKHYFEPKSNSDWSTLKIYCPVTGKITRVEQEWAGTKLEIVSENYPAFRFSIFHIVTSRAYSIGDEVDAGEQLGTHIGNQTMSDISVIVNDPTRQGRMISYFETITDDVFALYTSRGIGSREELIIPKQVRDANPLTCNGESFSSPDVLESWITLQ